MTHTCIKMLKQTPELPEVQIYSLQIDAELRRTKNYPD